MSTIPKKPGRPCAAPQAAPTALSAPLARRRITIEIPHLTVHELGGYVAWLEAKCNIPKREAYAAAIDWGLTTLFRADKLWRAAREAFLRPPPARAADDLRPAVAAEKCEVGPFAPTEKAPQPPARPTGSGIFDETTAT